MYQCQTLVELVVTGAHVLSLKGAERSSGNVILKILPALMRTVGKHPTLEKCHLTLAISGTRQKTDVKVSRAHRIFSPEEQLTAQDVFHTAS